MLADLVTGNRSYRRFRKGKTVDMETLRELVALARLAPTGGNKQPLKYLLSADAGTNAGIFPHLAWAGYLRDWSGPEEGERPGAYIVILGDTEVSADFGCDHGIAAQTIMLGAAEKGLGGCVIGSVNRDGLCEALKVPERYEILLVLALGEPGETVILEELGAEGDVEYWRDEQGAHHVPKRSLNDLILR